MIDERFQALEKKIERLENKVKYMEVLNYETAPTERIQLKFLGEGCLVTAEAKASYKPLTDTISVVTVFSGAVMEYNNPLSEYLQTIVSHLLYNNKFFSKNDKMCLSEKQIFTSEDQVNEFLTGKIIDRIHARKKNWKLKETGENLHEYLTRRYPRN